MPWQLPAYPAEAVAVFIAASEGGAVVAALIAGGFTLVNSLLTIWLTSGRARLRERRRDELERRERERRRRRGE